MTDVVFTVKLKLAWQDQMAFDTELPHLAFRVGHTIGWSIDKSTGVACIARTTLANKLGVCVRSIDDAIKKLVARGHIEVEKTRVGSDGSGQPVHGGRGNANLYRPTIKTVKGTSPFTGSETANEEIGKGERNGGKGRSGLHAIPFNTHCSSRSSSRRQFCNDDSEGETPAQTGLAGKRVFVAKADPRWKRLEARHRREVNPLGAPAETFHEHGNQTGWRFPREWVAELDSDEAGNVDVANSSDSEDAL